MNTPANNNYPTLSEMGVKSPHEVSKYYITSLNRVDVLRIVYDRPDGSFLTSSRSYKFPRVDKEGGTGGTATKTHPMLREAVRELDRLLETIASKESIAAEILSEIALLEEDIAMRSEHLKTLAAKITAAD